MNEKRTQLALHWQILIGMLLGAAIGITLNVGWGERRTRLEADQLPPDIDLLEIVDTPDRIEITIEADGERYRLIVDGTGAEPASYPTLGALEEDHPQAYALFQEHGRSGARWVGDGANRLGGLFLRMLQMVAVPLIVTSLVTGVLGLAKAERLGRMFGYTVTYYLCTSMVAIVVGLTMVNLLQPGRGEAMVAGEHRVPETPDGLGEVLMQQLETIIPQNPFGALAEPNFLSIISFSLAFAIFAVLVGGRTAEVLRDVFSAGFEVMMAMTMAIVRLAPLGVLLLMLYVTATQGISVFQALFWYMLTVVCALAFHAMVVMPAILRFIARRDPLPYVQAMSPALVMAFSSASSNATLPLTLACVEQRAGVDNRVGSFVLPLGATVNMDGTALYEVIAVLFIAQLYLGESLGLTQQILVAVTALLASIGAAGIPHAGLVMMVIILQVVNLPIEMQGIIIAVDRVLDMCRTSVNVWSDACGCAVVERMEGERGK